MEFIKKFLYRTYKICMCLIERFDFYCFCLWDRALLFRIAVTDLCISIATTIKKLSIATAKIIKKYWEMFDDHFGGAVAFMKYKITFDLNQYKNFRWMVFLSGFYLFQLIILNNYEPEIYEFHVELHEKIWEILLNWDFIYILIEVLCFILPILIAVAFTTLLERKVLAAMQRRVGPNFVGPKGFGQPFADALKLLLKEMVIPSSASRILFLLAPMFTLLLSLMTWFVVPMSWFGAMVDIQIGLAYIFALSSLGVYSIILARLV